MRHIESMTLNALIESLKSHIEDSSDALLVGVCGYGDRCDTQQAIPLSDPRLSYVVNSGYSSTKYAITDDVEECDKGDCQKVITLNYDMDSDIESALTMEDMLIQLEVLNTYGHGELMVVFGSDYGDRHNTTQANRIYSTEFNEVDLVKTPYSYSGYKFSDDECELDGYFSLS